MNAERKRRKRLAEQHDGGYVHVCYREDMWDWGEPEASPPAATIHVFSVTEQELEALALAVVMVASPQHRQANQARQSSRHPRP